MIPIWEILEKDINYLKRISKVDSVDIILETPDINSECSLEKELNELIRMNS